MRELDLLGIGVLGGVQNLYAAGAERGPAAFGIHLDHIDTITGSSVAKVLKEAEERYEMVGSSLLDIFFPGSLRVKDDRDLEFWQKAIQKRKEPTHHGKRVDL